MTQQLFSCVLLLVVMALSSSSFLSKKNRGKTTIVTNRPVPAVVVEIREQTSNDALATEKMWFEELEFHLHDPNKKKKRKRKATEKNDCSERVSCRNFLWPRAYHGNDLTHRNCLCDELCETFDDCCRNYTRHQNVSVNIVDLRPKVIACQSLLSINPEFDDFTYSIVVRCPANYNEPYIREKCELSNSAGADLFYRLPVNGRTSKVLYINFYCAICNGDIDVIYWTGQRDICHVKPKDALYGAMYGFGYYYQQPSDSHNTTIQELLAKNSDCKTIFIRPVGYSLRRCKAINRQCSADWTDRETARKCEERSELNNYVYHKNRSIAFRNKHCAFCNHLPEAETTCVDPTHFETFLRPEGGETSLKIFFDLSARTQSIDEVIFHIRRTKQSVELRECDPGFVYDPYAGTCRLLFCPKGYRPTDRGCESYADYKHGGKGANVDIINLEEPSIQTRFHPTQTNLSCSPMIRLNESEYTILSNQSAYVFRMNSLYTEDQYALEPPFLYICVPLTRQYNVTLLVMFQFDHVQSIMSFIGVILSLVGLLIQFVIYMIFPELRNIPGKCIVCLVVSLFIGQLTFLFVESDGPACFFLAAAMHFGFLAAFSWMNVLAFDIFRTFRITNAASLSSSGSKWKRFLAYSVYAWLTPLLIVGLCITMDVLDVNESFRPHYGEGVCWITSQTALLMFFVVPVGVILIVNIVFFCTTLFCICRSAHVAQAATPKTDTKSLLLVSIKLFFIMGLTWLFGFMASFTDWAFFWYAFIVFNSLQGLLLCVISLCTMKVYRLMKTKWSTKARNSTTSQQRNEKALTNEIIVSKDNKAVAKETCM